MNSLRKKIAIDQVLNHIKNSRVLVRVDFNVPIQNDQVTDTRRISESIPTIKKLLDSGARNVVLMSHMGRPDGKKNKKYSLRPVAPILEKLLGKKVTFLDDCIGPNVESVCNNAKDGEIILLENLRFYAEEEGSFKDDKGNKVKVEKDKIAAFRKSLTTLGDIYVNDAFGAAHRAHSSITGINLPLKAAGLLMKKELDVFGKVLEDPARPFTMILGGAKVADKIPLINNMLDKVNEIIVGGGVSYTFLKKVHGIEIGKSLFDKAGFNEVENMLAKAKAKGVKIHMPLDLFVARDTKATDKKMIEMPSNIDPEFEAFDGGVKTRERNHKVIMGSKTVIWNGPQGYFENPEFRNASYGVLESMIEATQKNGCFTVAGGGETGACIMTKPGAAEKLSHMSTGGGATLELLEGKVLPGLDCLSNIDDLAKIKVKSF